MVDKKFGDFQWDFSSQTGSTSCAPDECFIDRLGCSSPGKIDRRNLAISRKKWHISKLELLVLKLALQTFLRSQKVYFSSHTNGQHSAFDIFGKMGGTKNQKITILSKEIWEILTSKQIMITVEYLPSSLNKVADLESCCKVDSSESVLCGHVLYNLCLKLGTLTVDLFTSKLSQILTA